MFWKTARATKNGQIPKSLSGAHEFLKVQFGEGVWARISSSFSCSGSHAGIRSASDLMTLPNSEPRFPPVLRLYYSTPNLYNTAPNEHGMNGIPGQYVLYRYSTLQYTTDNQ